MTVTFTLTHRSVNSFEHRITSSGQNYDSPSHRRLWPNLYPNFGRLDRYRSARSVLEFANRGPLLLVVPLFGS